MIKNRPLLVLELLQTGITCIVVDGSSTPHTITIESKVDYTFNQTDFISNHICHVPFIIETIKKQNCQNQVIAWIVDKSLIESSVIKRETDKECLKNDITKARMLYHDKNHLNVYCDTISQALLLQMRLIAYGLKTYCLSPLSRFFVLSYVYNNHLFNEHNKGTDIPSIEILENFFTYKNTQKIIPFQKNIAEKNYFSYILIYGLLKFYLNELKKNG